MSVTLTDALITVQVSDDGTVDSRVTLGAGLRRVGRYAERSGGQLEVTTRASGGTLLRWTALLEEDRLQGKYFAQPRERRTTEPSN